MYKKWQKNFGAYILLLAGKGDKIEENKQKIARQIKNGEAFAKLKELVLKQGGDVSYLEDITKFPKTEFKIALQAERSGWIEKLDARKVGEASCILGAGRIKKEDSIDKTVGIELLAKTGKYVKEGETLAYVYAGSQEKAKQALEEIKAAYRIGSKPEKEKTILQVI